MVGRRKNARDAKPDRQATAWLAAVDISACRRWAGAAAAFLLALTAAFLDARGTGSPVVAPVFLGAAPSLPVAAGLDPRKPVYSVPVQERLISFGVNVDWGDEHLPGMLAVLAERDVRVTFFPTGRWARRRPDLIQTMAAAGHELGNHGDQHDHPASLSDGQLAELIRRASAVLEEIAGVKTQLFAPPYGEVDARIARVAAETGHWTIMWTVDTVDWRRPPPETIVQRVLGRVQPGAIVLMHPTEPTLAALPTILDRLLADGWRIVPVGELLRAGLAPPERHETPSPDDSTGPLEPSSGYSTSARRISSQVWGSS